MIVIPSEPLQSPAAPSWNIYQSCETLPMPAFIRCSVDGNYSHLVISGAPPAEVLEETWLSIYSDYCGRIGGTQITALIQRARMVNALSSKINRITMVVEAARLVVSDRFAEALKADGFKLDTTLPDAEYIAQLDAIMAKLTRDRMKLDGLAKELPKQKGKQQSTEKDFTKTLLECSKHEGYPVRAKDITVAEYCEHVARLRDYIDHMTKNNSAHGRK